ncbi:hypothetical protein BKA66DRAFT_587894 [Pyrenochaeta sp. MPI-SDFR-AT-0127]|nr:hypothetical protein BKA66DRAFT_587894 [Pyrenochaeta sp. MPI-SDFR-AT-0127]
MYSRTSGCPQSNIFELIQSKHAATGGREIVEASKDAIWGVGLTLVKAKKHKGAWTGQDQLGKPLMRNSRQVERRKKEVKSYGVRAMSSQFGFAPQWSPQRSPQQQQVQQAPRALSLPIPYVTETTGGGWKTSDIFPRLLLSMGA